jgi:hypothetical protein
MALNISTAAAAQLGKLAILTLADVLEGSTGMDRAIGLRQVHAHQPRLIDTRSGRLQEPFDSMGNGA